MPRTSTTTQQASKEATGRPRPSAPSVNRVILVGRLTADSELRYTSKGIAYARLSIATNDRSGGPEFHDVVAWRQRAEFAGTYLTKGRLVYVEGWLHGRTWQAENGTTRRSVEVIAETLRALTPRPEQQESAAQR